MEKCIGITLVGDPCPYDATVGEYCVLHAGGGDYFKANMAMLWSVYGRVSSALSLLGVLLTIFGSSKLFNVMYNGETRGVRLAELKDVAESLIAQLELIARLDDPRSELETLGTTTTRFEAELLSLVEQLAIGHYGTTQISAGQTSLEEMA